MENSSRFRPLQVAAGRRWAGGKRSQDRWWEMRDPRGELVCMTVYKRGAAEVVRRLAARRRAVRGNSGNLRRGCCVARPPSHARM